MKTRTAVQFAALAAFALAGLLALWCEAETAIDASVVPSTGASAAVPANAAGSAAPDQEAGATAARVALPLPPSLCLTVVDAAQARSLPGSRVAWRSLDGTASGQSVAGSDGSLSLSPAPSGPCILTIECAGYVRLHAILPPVLGKAVVALEGGGALTITVCDSDGRPAAGVAVALLPPRELGGGFGADFVAFATAASTMADSELADSEKVASLPELILIEGVFQMPSEPAPSDRFWQVGARWHAMDRRRVTGADGVAAWSGLPVADGYRFGILPPNHGDTDPPHERRRLVVGPEGVIVAAAPPPDLSGLFRIVSGATTALTGRVTRNGTVRGRIVAPRGTCPPARLFSITQAGGGGDVVPVTALDVADVQQADAEGHFAFAHVRPADYVLRSCWIEGGRDVHFASMTLRVLPGADVDLGDVSPTVGHSVAIELGIEGADRERLLPAAVFADAPRASALLMLNVVADSQLLADSLSEVSVLPFGVPFTFHGLPPGRIQLTAQPGGELETRAGVTRLQAGATQELSLPQAEVLRPCLRADVGHLVAIECLGEDGASREPLMLLARHRADDRIESFVLLTGESASGSSLYLRKGDYEFFVAMRGAGAAECAIANVSVPCAKAPSLQLILQTAAGLRGQLVDAAGQPVAGRLLQWTLSGWGGRDATWLFVATTDRDGRFEIGGVPAGRATAAASGTPELPTLSPGQNSLVLVVPER